MCNNSLLLIAGFDKPSFVYDHSEDQQQKDTILLNYCIDDIEGMCKVDSILSQGFAQFCQALGWAWSEVGWCGLVLAWSDEDGLGVCDGDGGY